MAELRGRLTGSRPRARALAPTSALKFHGLCRVLATAPGLARSARSRLRRSTSHSRSSKLWISCCLAISLTRTIN